jgi:hypothetical protein
LVADTARHRIVVEVSTVTARSEILPVKAPQRTAGRTVGGFFLFTGGAHAGIVFADPEAYRHFADEALFGFVSEGWAEVFMAAPAFWGLCLSLGEATLGVLLLVGGTAAKIGWVGVVTFHVLLMLFGFGIWLWCVPALVVLLALARRDWPLLSN